MCNPLIGSNLERGVENIFSFNRQNIVEKIQFLKQKSLKTKLGAAGALVISLLLFVTYLGQLDQAYAVEVDGKTVGLVKDEQQAQLAVKQLVNERTAKLHKPVVIKQKINITSVDTDSDDLLNNTQLQEKLRSVITYQIKGTIIKVDGTPQFAFNSKNEAEKFINALKDEYCIEAGSKVSFKEDVQMVSGAADPALFTDANAALKQVKEKALAPSYKVKDGDTLWDIASKNNLSVEKLIKLNPGFKPELMQIGERLNISEKQSLINVICSFNKKVQKPIAFTVETRRNDKLPQGQTKVLQQPQNGLKEVQYHVVALNGKLTERTVADQKVLKEVQNKIVEKGTRVMVASRDFGGGRLAKPANGGVTSPFGSRWGEFHSGVDLGAGYGSPVVAAAEGTVIRASWFSGYGECIDIDHGNGMITRYGHLSKIGVSVGQHVQRGQIIGNVGSTGRSTGPHLHFEVRIGGVAQDPLKYI